MALFLLLVITIKTWTFLRRVQIQIIIDSMMTHYTVRNVPMFDKESKSYGFPDFLLFFLIPTWLLLYYSNFKLLQLLTFVGKTKKKSDVLFFNNAIPFIFLFMCRTGDYIIRILLKLEKSFFNYNWNLIISVMNNRQAQSIGNQ